LIVLYLVCIGLADKAITRPNIILIVADDLGYGDLSITGSSTPTPNIDRLFTEGVTFNRAYANSPLCTPSRVAILTGQYQQRTSIDRNILFYERDIGLKDETVLISEVLKQADYNTAIIGKWHLGFTAESHPNNQGFDEFLGLISGSANYYSHKNLGMNDLWKNNREFYDDRYSTDLFTDEAISFIDKQEDNPFFVYLPYTTPHTPFQSPQHKAAVAYKGKNTSPIAKTIYQQMIQNFDENIGKLIRHLEKNQLAENTVIVFTSDHGGIPSIANNGALLGGKSNLTEGGLRVPLAIYSQGALANGRVVEEQVALIDLLPTFMDFAKIEAVEIPDIDGLSLHDLIFKEDNVQHHNALYFMSYDVKAMIQDNWKYFALPDGREFLFDIKDEEINLAEAFPDRLEAMAKAHEAWYFDVTEGVEQLPHDRGYGKQAIWGRDVLETSVITEPIETRMQRSNLYTLQENYANAFTDLHWIWENYSGESIQLKKTVQTKLCELSDYIEDLPLDCSSSNN